MRVLIAGIAGGLARQVALRLLEAGHEIIGIDLRPWTEAPRAIELHAIDVRKRAAEDVFRRRRPEAVIHMGTVTSLVVPGEQRYRLNLGSTRAIFEHCQAHGVKHAIFVGRHTFYGAGPDAALYHTESEPPLELGSYPELADLVAADLFASTALWRTPEQITTILRLTYTLGPSGSGTLASFLRERRVPMVLGFDPLFQFLHEHDVVSAIVLALEKKIRGVFNVAGPQPVPLSLMIRTLGRTAVPLPEIFLAKAFGRFGMPKLPRGALSHLKYPIVIDARAFEQATGFRARYDEVETLREFGKVFPRER